MDIIINYRPISLLITISKVLEKINYRHVYSFLEKNNLLHQSQYGFRTKHNCEQAILEFTASILHAMEDGAHGASIFLDLSKAFDTLNHHVLLDKLDKIGIRGLASNWFSSYLNGRSLVAKIMTSENKTTYSEPHKIMYGMAQGFCLVPLLFILFCNDIYQLPLYSHLKLFVDNTTMINSHRNKKCLEFMMCHNLAILLDWFKVNQLSINLNKTVMMNFWPTNGGIRVKSGEFAIPIVSHFKFPGVFIDENLSWDYQMEYLYNKLTTSY